MKAILATALGLGMVAASTLALARNRAHNESRAAVKRIPNFRLGMLAASSSVMLSGCTAQDIQWKMALGAGITEGFGPASSMEAQWEQYGFKTSADACAWAAVDHPCRSADLSTPYAPIPDLAALRDAGLQPQEAKSFLDQGLDATQVLLAIKLENAGYKETDAIAYAQRGMDVPQIEAEKKQQAAQVAAAAAQKAAATKAYKTAEAYCNGQIFSGMALLYGSPFGVTGKCYELGGLVVSQWLGPTEALAADNAVEVETDTPATSIIFPSGIYMGNGAYTYMTVSGEQRSIPSLRFTGLPPVAVQ